MTDESLATGSARTSGFQHFRFQPSAKICGKAPHSLPTGMFPVPSRLDVDCFFF